MQRVLVCGGRLFNDRELLDRVLWCEHTKEYGTPISVVITGGAPGADQLAKEWALRQGIPIAGSGSV